MSEIRKATNATKAGVMLEQFPNWLSKKRGGSNKWFLYWDGFLARDRIKSFMSFDNKYMEVPDPLVEALGRMVWEAYKRKQVLLVQKKVGPGEYYYFAIRRR